MRAPAVAKGAIRYVRTKYSLQSDGLEASPARTMVAYATLPEPAMSEEAKKILEACDAVVLAGAISAMESAAEVTKDTLAFLGLGAAAGIAISECTTGKEKADARQLVVQGLMKADLSLWRLFAKDKTMAKADRVAVAAAAINQRVAVVVRSATAPVVASAEGGKGTAYLLSANEEDRNYTVQGYDATEMKEQKKLIGVMHNIRLRDYKLGTVTNLKRVMYWVKTEGCTPDPDRLPLKVFKRGDEDSWELALVRAINSVVLCAAGVAARKELRDDGAGATKKFGVQWANAMVAEDLTGEIEEHLAKTHLTQPEMKVIAELIWLTLFKSTGANGGETASLAMAQLVSRAPEMMSSQVGRRVARGARDDGGAATPTRRKRGGKGTRRAAETPEKKDERPPKKAKTERPDGGWKDAVGELFSNGLKRMIGGNPAGSKCKYVAEGKDCPFKACAFSHK